MLIKTLATIGATALLTGSAAAHHSHAMYDDTVEATSTGVVKEFLWRNPHVWLNVVVVQDDGSEVEYSFEGASPSNLARRGWTPKSIAAGEEVTVVFYPLKDGDPGGNIRTVTLPDGSALR